MFNFYGHFSYYDLVLGLLIDKIIVIVSEKKMSQVKYLKQNKNVTHNSRTVLYVTNVTIPEVKRYKLVVTDHFQ